MTKLNEVFRAALVHRDRGDELGAMLGVLERGPRRASPKFVVMLVLGIVAVVVGIAIVLRPPGVDVVETTPTPEPPVERTPEPPQAPTPRVRQLIATVDGPMEKDVVRRVVRENVAGIRACYERALEVEPDLHARITIAFAIDRGGHVSVVDVVEDDSGSEALGSCVARAIGTLVFPVREDAASVTVRYPFELLPG